MKTILMIFLFHSVLLFHTAQSQDAIDREVDYLDDRVGRIERDISGYASSTYILFFTGVFCALWAQNSGRNAWLWFFLGFFFSAITLIALLIKNNNDRADQTYHDQ